MAAFRVLLVAIFVAIAVYTAIVAANHGLGLLEVFFRDIAAMGWPGQFNLDFMCFLALSALWLAWRHEFSAAGIALGIVGFFGGALFLSLYLLVVSLSVRGDVNALLLGTGRAQTLGGAR
ncbi:MAG: hypothetical protein R3E86_05570 [Pseudomonadales bacterium]